MSYKSFKIIPQQISPDKEITKTILFKGFALKFSKFFSFSVDDDFTKFEYKLCKPREEESYSNVKKYHLEINELIQISENYNDFDNQNINDEDKEIHICLSEKFSLNYRFFTNFDCQNYECSTKFDFIPTCEKKNEIINASLYVGHEIFELMVNYLF